MIHLDRNESGLIHSPNVLKTLIQNDDLRYYFNDEVDHELMALLSQFTDLPETHLMLANGSTNFLRLISNIYIHGPNDEVVCLFPTYIDFVEFVQFQGGTIKSHRITPEEREELLERGDKYRLIEHLVNHKTKIIYLCSPNNPIDFLWKPSEVAYLCEKFPNVIVLLDQAYYEFQEDQDPMMTWAGRRFQNLLVTRTFSKAYGLAGMRLGYLGGHPEILEKCRERYKSKEVNSLVKKLALQCLQEPEYYQNTMREVVEIRKWTVQELKKLGLKTWESQTNFLLVKTESDPIRLTEFLKEKGILIKNVSLRPYQIDHCVRISLGRIEEMKNLIEQIRIFLCND